MKFIVKFIKLNVVTGEVMIIEDFSPQSELNDGDVVWSIDALQTLADISDDDVTESDIYTASQLMEMHQQALELTEVCDSEYGKSLFSRQQMAKHQLQIPYLGVYGRKGEIEPYRAAFSQIYNLAFESAKDVWQVTSPKNLGVFHSAQYLPPAATSATPDCATNNLAFDVGYLQLDTSAFKTHLSAELAQHQSLFLPLMMAFNAIALEPKQIIGWDYGSQYWDALKQGFAIFDKQGNVVERFGHLLDSIKGNIFQLSDKVGREQYWSVAKQLLCLPADSKPKLFSDDKLFAKNIPYILIDAKNVAILDNAKNTLERCKVVMLRARNKLDKSIDMKTLLPDVLKKYSFLSIDEEEQESLLLLNITAFSDLTTKQLQQAWTEVDKHYLTDNVVVLNHFESLTPAVDLQVRAEADLEALLKHSMFKVETTPTSEAPGLSTANTV